MSNQGLRHLIVHNDLDLELRPYYRLKYIRHSSALKQPWTMGFVFTPNHGVAEGVTPILHFQESDRPVLSV